MADQSYLDKLKERAKESHVYKKHQLFGLEISQALDDAKHKALYIKLAKENSPEELLALAKRIAENPTVKNKGAYFMKIVTENKKRKSNGRKNSNGSS
ncbi:MAG: hypothetical protein HY093_00690 [Candidatus Liptonbacteria bacterium]|nr:hypothetical protein [Candidatus Liptonbacteria bacterium]